MDQHYLAVQSLAATFDCQHPILATFTLWKLESAKQEFSTNLNSTTLVPVNVISQTVSGAKSKTRYVHFSFLILFMTVDIVSSCTTLTKRS